jgi:ribosome-associated heat shock protein Hsp15
MATARDDASQASTKVPARPRPEPSGPVRLDKWLMVARVFKTRSLATKACELNRVEVNGQHAKPSRHLQVGDRVEAEITKDWKRVLVVKELRDKPIPKPEVPRLFEDLSPPRPELDPLERILRRSAVVRDPGAGRPTKKERRELERWRDP